MGLTETTYLQGKCTQENFFIGSRIEATVESNNDVKKSYNARISAVFFTPSVFFAQALTCETPLVAMQEYNILDVKCTDASGEDPFAEAKQQIGTVGQVNMTFSGNTMILFNDEEITLNRISESGCATVPTTLPPTLPPTTLPPTTLPPTTLPPTTLPPTEQPTTQPPTTQPTTQPPTPQPTTQPPTQPPTTQPPTPQPTTQPPTPAPKPNHLWMWIWISCGVVVLIVIIIVIVQCSKKPSKHEELEKKPLV